MSVDSEDKLNVLLQQKLVAHRLGGKPMRDVRQVAAFVRDRRMVMASGRSVLPALTEAISGRELPGSWMAHPGVYLIHNLTSRLDRRNPFPTVPLILGKQATFDRSLGGRVQRLAAGSESALL